MDSLKKYLATLKPALQQLACLYAYIGGDVSEDDRIQLSVHGGCMMGELSLLTRELVEHNIIVHETYNGLSFEHEHIRASIYGEVMRFAVEEHPEWLSEFDEWPLTRYRNFVHLQKSLRRCAAGKSPQPVMLDDQIPPYLIGLAHIRCYEPLISMIRDVDFPAFISACIRKWIKEDYTDEQEMIHRQVSQRKWDNDDIEIRSMKAIINYFDYMVLGRYTPPTGVRITFYDQLSKGVHAMAQGKSQLALKIFDDAMKANASKDGKGYILDGAACFYWVIAVWTANEKEAVNILSQFVKTAKNKLWHQISAAVLLADALLSPQKQLDMDAVSDILSPNSWIARNFDLQRKLVQLLVAYFTGTHPESESLDLRSAFLRHLGSAYITYNKFENKHLLDAFGMRPLLEYVKIQEPWEMMLDRLIAAEEKYRSSGNEEEHRVMYIILGDGESVEIREQNKLRDGRWGSGKMLPWSRFIGGTEPYMDRTDQAVVADVRYAQASRLTVGLIMPHLAGSDRVYTGEQTPYRRVTIEQQMPYVIIERTEAGFHLQSNLHYQDLLFQHCVYHRDDAMHYIYFPASTHARNILRELLSVTDYPAAAEEKLRSLLPVLANTIELHSDLLPEENEMNTSKAQAAILVRLTPDPTIQTMFDTYLLVRPLQGGKMTLPPTQGDRVIIDYNETSGRVRIDRDFETETRNLNLLMEFCTAHDISLSQNLSAHLTIENVLDLLAWANEHPEVCWIEWPEGEKLRMHHAQSNTWQLSLRQKGGWFAMEGQVKLEDNSVLTAQELLTALSNSHGGYVQLQEGDFLWLSEKLRKQLDALESITLQKDGEPSISVLQSSLLVSLVSGEVDIKYQPELLDYKQRIEAADHLEVAVPKALNATLRPYQLEGYQWMVRLFAWGAGACLADDMGLGKTIQTIAALISEAENGPALVVAPTSVILNWRNEIQRFAPSLRPVVLAESATRAVTLNLAQAGDVVLVSYGMLTPIREMITQKAWNIVCLDEAHNIKNRGTKSSAVCMELQANKRLILTGTPVQNHLGELWNLFQFINPGLLGTYEQFNAKYIDPIEEHHDEQRQRQLQQIVAPFMLRRTKQAVVQDLPQKTEITLNVELTPDEMAYYELLRKEAEKKFEEEGGQVSVSTLAELTRLRRTACSAELTNDAWLEGSSKVNVFMELVQNITDSGNSVLVFSQFTSFLDIVRKELERNGLEYLYLDGSVPLKQREVIVDDFQKGKKPIFLISLKAGGVGLNLTAANYVIHLDPWWNPAIEQQATDRAYRIGQQQAVTVYHLVSHHTIEEKILRLHEAKRNLADSILEGSDKNFKITAQDMLEMLSNNW